MISGKKKGENFMFLILTIYCIVYFIVFSSLSTFAALMLGRILGRGLPVSHKGKEFVEHICIFILKNGELLN